MFFCNPAHHKTSHRNAPRFLKIVGFDWKRSKYRKRTLGQQKKNVRINAVTNMLVQCDPLVKATQASGALPFAQGCTIRVLRTVFAVSFHRNYCITVFYLY